MFTIIQVLFNSPAKRHPKFALTGFVHGLVTQHMHISLVVPNPFGSMLKLISEQTSTASWQSLAVIGPPPEPVGQLEIPEHTPLELALSTASDAQKESHITVQQKASKKQIAFSHAALSQPGPEFAEQHAAATGLGQFEIPAQAPPLFALVIAEFAQTASHKFEQQNASNAHMAAWQAEF